MARVRFALFKIRLGEPQALALFKVSLKFDLGLQARAQGLCLYTSPIWSQNSVMEKKLEFWQMKIKMEMKSWELRRRRNGSFSES